MTNRILEKTLLGLMRNNQKTRAAIGEAVIHVLEDQRNEILRLQDNVRRRIATAISKAGTAKSVVAKPVSPDFIIRRCQKFLSKYDRSSKHLRQTRAAKSLSELLQSNFGKGMTATQRGIMKKARAAARQALRRKYRKSGTLTLVEIKAA